MSDKVDNQFFGLFRKFFESGGTTLLLKGAPGSGKTTLAFTIALVLKPSVVSYISTRVSEENIDKQFPWLKQSLPETSIRDVRLGKPELLVEEFLQALKHENSLVIVDSWDSFARILPQNEALKTESALVHLASTPVAGAKVVFVSERVELSPLEYASDGVIQTEFETVKGRALRRLKILKLRGVRVENPVFLFTLEGAKLSVAPLSDFFKLPERFEVVRKPQNLCTLGIRDFDRVFGVLEFGCSVGYEFSSNVRNELKPVFSAAALSNFVAHGGGALIVSHLDKYMERILLNAQKVFSEQVVKSRVRIFTPSFTKNELASAIPNSADEFVKELESAKEEVRANAPSRKVMLAFSISTLQQRFSNERQKLSSALYSILSSASENGDVVVFNGSSSSPFTKSVYYLVDKHIRVTSIDGATLVYGVKPHTPFYFLRIQDQISLIELV
ncbi:hypothetical protein B9Q13_06085 [Candidatus Marsarchaeota G2 archaeon ECH_B_SAG-G16]|uniref:AAA+ ATPase domain-containing protein n=1 Tax=Candidatus Marsarchaeota G2 archaeon ECH_B_SAG-G16 TaxID=1978167 RepID=A0A2R6BZ16_9ARCH|nr:MAG: hypothetical protein B9Q13_06085 [Candidatus Marsarchaeota G2 archaeon ECH_B_SAG-G16]